MGVDPAERLEDDGAIARVIAASSGENKCAHVREPFFRQRCWIAPRQASPRNCVAPVPTARTFSGYVDGRCIDPVMPLLNAGARMSLCGMIDDDRRAYTDGDHLRGFPNACWSDDCV